MDWLPSIALSAASLMGLAQLSSAATTCADTHHNMRQARVSQAQEHNMRQARIGQAQHSRCCRGLKRCGPFPWVSAAQARGERVPLRTCKQQLRACFLTAT